MSTSTRSLPVLLDCDPGIDDAFALAYVACRDDVETVGVVTTAGNVGQDDVLRNALGALSYTHQTQHTRQREKNTDLPES